MNGQHFRSAFEVRKGKRDWSDEGTGRGGVISRHGKRQTWNLNRTCQRNILGTGREGQQKWLEPGAIGPVILFLVLLFLEMPELTYNERTVFEIGLWNCEQRDHISWVTILLLLLLPLQERQIHFLYQHSSSCSLLLCYMSGSALVFSLTSFFFRRKRKRV